MRVGNLSGPHVPAVLSLSLSNCSLLRTGTVCVEAAGEGRAGARSQAVPGAEESFSPSREESIVGKTSKCKGFAASFLPVPSLAPFLVVSSPIPAPPRQSPLPLPAVSKSSRWCPGGACAPRSTPKTVGYHISSPKLGMLTEIKPLNRNAGASETMSSSTKPKSLLLSFFTKDRLAEFLVLSLSGRAGTDTKDLERLPVNRTLGS